jgi:lipopolysaccharide export system protein LptA
MRRVLHAAAALASPLLALLVAGASPARAQGIDLSHGGPVEITASQGMEWRQQEQQVIARGDARAVRGDVTVTADQLVAFYRKKAGAAQASAGQSAPASGNGAPQATPASVPVGGVDTGDNEIYRLEARGRVNIYTPTDHAIADVAIYDIDQAVLVLTGKDLKITTPQDVLTARDTMEYYSQRHMAVARGQATVVTNDGRRVYADTLVAYTKPDGGSAAGAPAVQRVAATSANPGSAKPGGGDPLAAGSGKLEKVDAFGNVELRTPAEVIRGDRGTYVPDTGLARLVGHVHITRGLNQLNGDEAIVNMRTGVSTLTRVPGQRVEGLVVPNDPLQRNQSDGQVGGAAPSGTAPGGAAKPAKRP